MKIGFLGAGAMGGAILSGAVSAGVLDPKNVYVSDVSEKILEKYAALGCNICKNNDELGKASDIVVLAVKPQYAAPALATLGDTMNGKAVISIMAGATVERIRSMIKGDIRVLRCMPNTPALVNAGAFALCNETDLTAEEKAFAEKLFTSIGIVEWMSEKLIDTACGLSGSGPAFVALFIEALADGGVLEGLPRPTAYRLAAQTVMGTAKLIMDTGMHPGQVKDMVSSPGGTTITGCQVLEEMGFRAAAIDAVQAATNRSREL
ncbi:MAG: pyrroline-5-carboxylate reductase [Clostridia bacterium]|nr:pyrroline-5-carboxylate reductase [Clostridia bacterium]